MKKDFSLKPEPQKDLNKRKDNKHTRGTFVNKNRDTLKSKGINVNEADSSKVHWTDLSKFNWNSKPKKRAPNNPDPMKMANAERWFVKKKKEEGRSKYDIDAARKGFKHWNKELGKKKPLPESTDDSTKVLTMKDPLNKGGEKVNTKEKKVDVDAINKERKGFATWVEAYQRCLSEASWRDHFGWINDKGKDIEGKGKQEVHQQILAQHGLKGSHLEDYRKAFKAGWSRYFTEHGNSTFHHDASLHGDPQKYHTTLKHIQNHLKKNPYHTGGVTLDICDHNGYCHYKDSPDVKSALGHLRKLRRYAAEDMHEETIPGQYISEANWRDHFGWITDKGKDIEGKGKQEVHQQILAKHGLKGKHLEDYDKAFKAGWTRYFNDYGHATYHHDASVHGDPQKYHTALKHIQKHLKNTSYNTGGVSLDIFDHKGYYHYRDHPNVKSAVGHLKRLQNDAAADIHEETLGEESRRCLSEANWNDYFGWITDKGKDIKGKGNEVYHQQILAKHGLKGSHLEDYRKAFKAGWTRYFNDYGNATFHHDATVHKDPKKYHTALKHIQKHIEKNPYHTGVVSLDIHDHKGKDHYREHDNVKSAIRHLKKLQTDAAADIHEETLGEEYQLCLSEASWRDHFGWINDKGKDHEGKGDEEYHQQILAKHGLRGETLSDYKKAFKAGWTRYYNNHGSSTFEHDATVHKDPKKYHTALKHIQKHLKTAPYHTSRISFDIRDHKGKYHYTDHPDIKSAIGHLKRLQNDAAADIHEEMIPRQYGKAYPLAVETAPPGWEGTVKKMKKHKNITNPFALAWYLKNKGAKSHVKEAMDPDEAIQASQIMKGAIAQQMADKGVDPKNISKQLKKVDQKYLRLSDIPTK